MTELARRRRVLMGEQAGDGKIWLFDNGAIGSSAGAYEAHGPNGYINQDTITVSVDDTISFVLSDLNYSAIKTLVTKKTINAQGKNLHIILKTKCSDSRARNCWFYAYASQTVVDTTNVPDNAGISQYFPNGDGTTFYIPYNGGAEKETEIIVPITQDATFISIGVLKQYIFVRYATITQMWIE